MERKEQIIREAEALWKEGQRQEGIEKLEAFRRRFGDDLEVLRKLSDMYVDLDPPYTAEKAIDLCLEILRIEPEDIETRMLLAIIHWGHLGEYEKALEEFRRIIEIDPSQVEAYRSIAGIFPNAGFAEEALEALQKAIALKPDHGELYSNVARIYELTGDREKELEWLEKAIGRGVFDEVGTRRRIEELKEKLKKG